MEYHPPEGAGNNLSTHPETPTSIDGERNLIDYLEFNGWHRLSEGDFGALWSKKNHDAEVAIPKGIRFGTGMWDGTIERVAYWERLPNDVLDKTIRRFWMDVSDFRASSSIVRGNNIAAEAGSSLFSGAWKMLRASATTARGAKAVIGGNYSQVGDRSIEGAMFAQTEPGSYVLPLLVPIERTTNDLRVDRNLANTPLSPDDFFEVKDRETEQRRATRTMAQALTAVKEKIIEPAVEPTKRVINEAVIAGVSREFVKAIHEMIAEETISSVDVTFKWAPRAGDVPRTKSVIEIPKASALLLSMAIRQMNSSKEPMTAVLSGPIFALYHPKGSNSGEATIEAAYKGRIRRVAVNLKGLRMLDDAHRWFHSHETLLVEGAIRSTSQGLRVDYPRRVVALGQTMLFDS